MSHNQGQKRKRVVVELRDVLSKYRSMEPADYASAFETLMEEIAALAESSQKLVSLPATSLSLGEARRLFKLEVTKDVYWREIEKETVPQYLLDGIERIQAITSQDFRGLEAFSRTIIDQILISAIWEENFGEKPLQEAPTTPSLPQPKANFSEDPALLQLQHETRIQTQILYEGKPRLLSGFADYTVWYDSPKNTKLATNLVIIEAKIQGAAGTCIPQLTAYMGIIHSLRKAEGKKNAIVYGVASDGMEYRFCRIDNDSRWSQSPIWEWDQGNESLIYSTFRTLVRVAALAWPSTSPIKDQAKRRKVQAAFRTPSRVRKFDFGLNNLSLLEEDDDMEIVPMPDPKKGGHREI